MKTSDTQTTPRPVGEAAACESCGGGFDCGASLAGCWCSQVKVSESKQAELRARFTRCLCRACLERFAAEGRGGSLTVRGLPPRTCALCMT